MEEEVDSIEAPRVFNLWTEEGLVFLSTPGIPVVKILPGTMTEIQMQHPNPIYNVTVCVTNGKIIQPTSFRKRVSAVWRALKGE